MVRKFFCAFAFVFVFFTCCLARARDPIPFTLNELNAKSDLIVIGRVEKSTPSNKHKALSQEYFDEFEVTFKVLTVLKGGAKHSDSLAIIAYKSNGRGIPGNFGSLMDITAAEDKRLHMLFLQKRGEIWIPTSGYLDGGESDFVIKSNGFTE